MHLVSRVILVVAVSVAYPAHAGFFDFLSGSTENKGEEASDKTPADQDKPAKEAQPANSGAAWNSEESILASTPAQPPARMTVIDCAPPTKVKAKNKSASKAGRGDKPAPTCGAPSNTAPSAPGSENAGLLAGTKLSAKDLMGEMRSIKGTFSAENPMQALTSLLTPPQLAASNPPAINNKKSAANPTEQSVAALATLLGGGGGNGNSGGLGMLSGGGMGMPFASLGSLAVDGILEMLTAEISYAALDTFFAELLEDKESLSKITVDVPDISKLSPELRKQTIKLAAFLAAIKGSALVIDSGQKEFEKAKESYKKVIEMREQAAKILADALLTRDQLEHALKIQQARGSTPLDAADLQYLEKFKDSKPEELVRDFAAQNLALAYLRQKNPDAWRDYSLQMQEVKSHYGAYARATAGAGSMLGFSALFLKQAKKMLDKQGILGGATLLPLTSQGLSEVVSLAPRLKNVFDFGDDLTQGSFMVVQGNETVKRQASAKKVFGSINDDALTQFRSDLIRAKGNGYLFRLYQKNPHALGQLSDRVVSRDARASFRKDYLKIENDTDFSFNNALGGKLASKRKNLAQDIYMHPVDASATEADDKAVANVQKDLLNNIGEYSNSDLRKLMFVNSSGTAAQPRIDIGAYSVRIDTIGLEGLLDYDDFVAEKLAQAKVRDISKGVVKPARKAKS